MAISRSALRLLSTLFQGSDVSKLVVSDHHVPCLAMAHDRALSQCAVRQKD